MSRSSTRRWSPLVQNPDQSSGQSFPSAHCWYQDQGTRSSLSGASLALWCIERHPWSPLTRCQEHAQLWHPQMSPDMVQYSLGQSHPWGENHCSRGFSELSKPGDSLVSIDQEIRPERKGERNSALLFPEAVTKDHILGRSSSSTSPILPLPQQSLQEREDRERERAM